MTRGAAVGESLHEIGRDGARRAKTWLEKTGRVDVHFTRYDADETPFLQFKAVSGASFSFDIGGVFVLDTSKRQFFGEVKKVASHANQGILYEEYLAKCYRATVQAGKPYHFMWITWHPFSIGNWTNLCDASEIKMAVDNHKPTYCGDVPVDETICEELAERLWLIVLSDRQEMLSMSDDMLGTVKQAIVKGIAP